MLKRSEQRSIPAVEDSIEEVVVVEDITVAEEVAAAVAMDITVNRTLETMALINEMEVINETAATNSATAATNNETVDISNVMVATRETISSSEVVVVDIAEDIEAIVARVGKVKAPDSRAWMPEVEEPVDTTRGGLTGYVLVELQYFNSSSN